MGRKFNLSNMMPNAWFFKLRHSDQKNHHLPHFSSSSTASASASSSSSSSSFSSSSSSAMTRLSSSRPKQLLPRKSYHFARQLAETNGYYDFPLNAKLSDSHPPEPPRKSSKQRRRRRTVPRSPPKPVGSSASPGCRCEPKLESVWRKSESPVGFSSSPFGSSPDGDFRTDTVLATETFHGVVSWTESKANSCSCKTNLKYNDIIIDIDEDSIMTKAQKENVYNSLPELELAPIIAKAATFTDMVRDIKKMETKNPRSRKKSAKTEEINSLGSLSVKIANEEKIVVKEQTNTPSRKNSGNSLGVRLRVNSPRIGSRRSNGGSGRKSVSSSSTNASTVSNKSLSDSLAIVKSSFDPQRDFRESMVEMIVENNIRASKDLEDLLACYLSLNADEYHDLIIEVFKQIWFDLPSSQIKK